MNYRKLKGFLLMKGATYTDCAEALGISLSGFNNKINQKNEFTIQEVRKLSDFLELTEKETAEVFLGGSDGKR